VNLKVVNLAAYRGQQVAEVLEELLEAARKGEISGLAYIVKVGPGDNRAGLAGIYKYQPDKALRATFQLERLLASDQGFGHSRM
jgi:hypothetical protein